MMDKAEFDKWAAFNKFVLTPEEEAYLRAEFEDLLLALDPLAQADFGDAQPLVYAGDVQPAYREDEAKQEISREDILANAPEQAEHCFTVPRVAD